MATSGALARQPINRNFLSQLNFKFLLLRAPNVEFFLQRVNVPGINIPSIDIGNPFVQIPHSGEQVDFGPLGIDFKVDEDFANYLEIHEWLYGLGFPENFNQYKELVEAGETLQGSGVRSDISLMILNSVKKPNLEFTFHDAFPTSLSDLVFTTTDPDVDYLEATTTFDYTYVTVKQGYF
jgi:hypothetical protein